MISTDTPMLVDEYGIFHIADEAVLRAIAGGISAAPTFLDNHCVTNDSKCGKTAPTPSDS